MKVFISIILLIISQVIDCSQKYDRVNRYAARSLNTKLKNFLENDLRYIMRNNEPILDPYISEEQYFEYNDRLTIFNGKLNDFTIDHLSHYIVKYSNVNILSKKVNIKLLFPTVTSNGFYNFDARYQNIPHQGNGHYNVTVRNFSFSAEGRIKIFGGLQLKSLALKIALGGFDLSATNDYFESEEESKAWSAKVSQFIPAFIAKHHDSIVKYFTPKVIAIINEQLQNN